MAMQTFECAIHGEFDRMIDLGADVPKSLPCPVDVPGPVKGSPDMLQCGEDSPWVPPQVAAIFNW